MKQTLITMMCLLAFTGTKAQIEKGSSALTLNAGLGFNYNSQNSYSSNSIRLTAQPVFEHFIDRNLSLGAFARGSFDFYNSEDKSSFSTSSSKYNSYVQTYSLGLQLKKYWFAGTKVAFTASPQLAANYYELNSTSEYAGGGKSTNNFKYWYYSAGLNLGALYFITPNVAIEAQTNFINYSYYPENSNINERYNITLLALESNLTLGIKYILGNKEKGSNP